MVTRHSTFKNLTNYRIEFSINNTSTEKISDCTLNPKESYEFKINDGEHKVVIVKINNTETNKAFVIKASSVFSFNLEDFNNDIYIKDHETEFIYRSTQKNILEGGQGRKNNFDKNFGMDMNMGNMAGNFGMDMNMGNFGNMNNMGSKNGNHGGNFGMNMGMGNFGMDMGMGNFGNMGGNFGMDMGMGNFGNMGGNFGMDMGMGNFGNTTNNNTRNNQGGNNKPENQVNNHQNFNNTNQPNFNKNKNSNFGNFNMDMGGFGDINNMSGISSIQSNFNDMKFDNFGEFIETKEQFDLAFVKFDILNNTDNIFNQLPRNIGNNKNKKNFVDQNQIKFFNHSFNDVYIKISHGLTSSIEEFELIKSHESTIVDRTERSIYKLNIVNNPEMQGPVYNVKSGCVYIFNEQNNLTDLGKNTLISTSIQYEHNFELKKQFNVFYNKNDVNMTKEVDKNKIIIINKGNDNISIKIEGDSTNNFEDFIEVEPLVYVTFERIEGCYISSFYKKGNNSSDKYVLNTNNCYIFDDAMKGIIDFNTKKNVEKYIDKGNDDINVNNGKKNTDYFTNRKINNFFSGIFGHIEIKNQYIEDDEIYVRIKAGAIGSEDFFTIEKNSSHKWKRIKGELIIEIVTEDLRSKRFIINPRHSYTFNSQKELINDINYNKVDEVKDIFGGSSLVYYDKDRGEYVSKKIDYDSDIYVPHDDYKIQTEKLEYFCGIKPKYLSGNPYIDPEFPPDRTSIAATDPYSGSKRIPHFRHSNSEFSQESMDNLCFKRPKEVFKKKYFLFKDEICYDDVNQGQIGDCYLMSVMASLSLRSDLIKNIFKTKTVNPDGFYEIFFYEKSQKKIMFIDDHLVTYKSSYCPDFTFAKPNGEELWVMLLEKAYAKYEGGYSNIIGGLGDPELTFFTGAMCRTVMTDDDHLWNEMSNGCKNNYIITSGSNQGSGNHFNSTDNNIAHGHAYSILDVKEFRSYNRNLRLVKLRNPWGKSEWKGEYSDDSNLWTQELKDFFGYESVIGDNGVFFMPFENFVNEFSDITICLLDSGKKKM